MAQTISPRLNHISLHVSDVPKSKVFYGHLLGFEEIDRPNFSFAGAWYHLGNQLYLHLIEGKDYLAQSSNRGNHFAFAYPDVNALEQEFRSKGIEIVSNKIRVDGVRQMFIKDPDGYYIEFSEEKNINWLDQ